MKKYRFLISVLSAAIASNAYADEQPAIPFLKSFGHTSENSFLDVECTKIDSMTMNCDFVQTSLRKHTSEQDRAKELQNLLEPYKAESRKEQEKTCKYIKDILTSLRTGNVPKDIEGMSDLNEFHSFIKTINKEEKDDKIQLLEIGAKASCEPTEDNIRAFISSNFERKLQTCNVSVHKFSQSFKWQPSGQWIHNSQPSGMCGAIHITKFNKIKDKPIETWEYVTQKIITNKNDDKENILQCKDLDEGIYQYTTTRAFDDRLLNCKYIKYGLF